jgi:hypothetical protein
VFMQERSWSFFYIKKEIYPLTLWRVWMVGHFSEDWCRVIANIKQLNVVTQNMLIEQCEQI